MIRSMQIIVATLKMVFAVLVAPCTRIIYPSVWLVGERRNQARDNGYCFFSYMRKKHPKVQIYYIIDRCDDAKKIKHLGNVVYYNSLKHYLLFAAADVQISTHANIFWPDNVRKIGFIVNRIRFKRVFLPHGVSYGYTAWATKEQANFDLFFCSGYLEYQNVLANYGYKDEEVAYVGIPRLDLWHEPVFVDDRRILLMPTWRARIVYDNQCKFQETKYYKAYQNLLNSSKLAEFLVQNKLRLIFYLHHDMQKYANSFRTNCSNIEIVCTDSKYDIQDLLRTSAVLITDYSSVHFDFSYMGKPVLYYQFDADDFFLHQYQKSVFSAEEHGFGPVAYTHEQLIEEIIQLENSGFKLIDPYRWRMRDFYRIYDNNNSERVYQAILEKTKNGWV